MVNDVRHFSQEEAHQYKEVRGLMRGLELLRALNRTPAGAASTSALAAACGIHRTTAKRLLETLRSEGLVRVGYKDGFYVLSEPVLELSQAMHRMAWIADVVTPVLHEASARLVWPCDFATYESGQIALRESSHRWCGMARNPGMVGESIPVLRSALGRAYIAACSPHELERVLHELRGRNDACGELARDVRYVDTTLAETRQRGYGINRHRRTGDAVVAVGVCSERGLLGAINLAYPTQLMSDDELEQRFIPTLRDVADRVARGYEAWSQAQVLGAVAGRA